VRSLGALRQPRDDTHSQLLKSSSTCFAAPPILHVIPAPRTTLCVFEILVDDKPDLPPGLLHSGKIRRRKLDLFPIAWLRAIGAIILFELGSEVRSVLGFLAQTISIELGESH